MKSVAIGTVNLAAGMPKIGVVLTGTKRSTLLGQAGQVLSSAAQIVEWRLTGADDLENRAELINTATQLRQVLGTIPMIATIQVDQAIEAATYYGTYLTLVNNRLCDAIELDLNRLAHREFMTLTIQMRSQKIKLILNQTYQTTPNVSQVVTDYQAMAAAGADIARVRMQPETATALLTLMTATATAGTKLSLPLIVTATGALGRYGAACGQLFGSTIVFGRVGRVGGMGQLPVSQLKQTLQTLATVEGA
ncbi:type I 3-dehydroquinate dehydratase [Lactiplantibacillus sp. WILCCON 0030]|uniref:3-dehydroquinate dehydratase n=1 Tax=Lactiplantibacillus brownii TaxID=3069269 RepID=A0ABU1AB20_9LACO|nr:type I 3-dehydroquinate dehydratase [Lactiplantibacillus brownii]MDQ7938111.1 type I 3-dehydroquinate dehydratase [Lactiplantibacillus brownii]